MEDLKIYHSLILEVWQAMKKQLQELDERDEDYNFWTEVLDIYAVMAQKYKGTAAEQFAITLCCEAMREVERVSIGRR